MANRNRAGQLKRFSSATAELVNTNNSRQLQNFSSTQTNLVNSNNSRQPTGNWQIYNYILGNEINLNQNLYLVHVLIVTMVNVLITVMREKNLIKTKNILKTKWK